MKDSREDRLGKRVLEAYKEGAITAQKAADILDMPLREFLDLLEKKGVPINWDDSVACEFMTKHYGE